MHEIADTIVIRSGGGGLAGSATIVQTNPERPIIRIEHAPGATLRGLTLTRPEGRRETRAEAVIATDTPDLALVDLRVIDNQTRSAAIELRNCVDGQIRDCLIRNYQRTSVDDRTATPITGTPSAASSGRAS